MSSLTAVSNQKLAHVAPDGHGGYKIHRLEDHLAAVGEIASLFASEFGNEDWANSAGVWHDLGKYSSAFQSYIKRASGFDPEAILEGQKGRVDHSTAGAIYAMNCMGPRGKILAYIIAGHHAGLPDWLGEESGNGSLAVRLQKTELLDAVLQSSLPREIAGPTLPSSMPPKGAWPSLWIRMLFSCLVDADFLDTEAFMDSEKSNLRPAGNYELTTLGEEFNAFISELAANSRDSSVNQCRAEILKQCENKAELEPGLFSLTVPTGGGKTLSSMAFALRHAIKYKKRRIIYVIPYTSIIEQTADIFRTIFGDRVLEHHSNLDSSIETVQSRLASENWDSPIVITTNVQFFESLFAARTSRVRKLHNIANSVVILDEAQLLPPDFLTPVLKAVQNLAKCFGVTFILSTATQPALNPRKSIDWSFEGLTGIREIVDDPDALHEKLKRVHTIIQDDLLASRSWAEIAEELKTYEKVLCIVNRRDDCRELYELMPEGTIHLSALMCGAHRSDVIAEIKRRLKCDEILRVISTQLVEAGVDIDFPVVYRALAGLDSIAQAAGRCNREGRLPQGRLVVFVPPVPAPRGHLRQAETCARQLLAHRPVDPLEPVHLANFFSQLYWQRGTQLDKHKIVELLQADDAVNISFRTAAAKFQLIDSTVQAPIIVRFKNSPRLIQELKAKGPSRQIMRKLQRYVVNVPKKLHQSLLNQGEIEECFPGIFLQVNDSSYSQTLGFRIDNPIFHDVDDLIV